MSDLSVVKQFSMPPPMHFKEEGGASLSPDGTKFIAVCKPSSDVFIHLSDVVEIINLHRHNLQILSSSLILMTITPHYRVDLIYGFESSTLNQEKYYRLSRDIMDLFVVCVIIHQENMVQVAARMVQYGYGASMEGSQLQQLQPLSIKY